jgi:protein-S-isoprenylcysteine O-methyltransferase Ste14
MKTRLIFKAALFTILLPGTVTIIIPYIILSVKGENEFPELTLQTVFALIAGLAGVVVLLYSIWEFAFYGKGTLSAIDPPKVLVVRGLYRYTRNPMYLAVLCILMSEAICFNSITTFTYAVSIFLAFHLFVVYYEEPHLKKIFDNEYKKYIKKIPRWGISLIPFKYSN